MPRYYFDIKDGDDFTDLVGSNRQYLVVARVEAARLSAEILKEMPERFWHYELWTMTIFSDDARTPLFTLKFLAEDTMHPRV